MSITQKQTIRQLSRERRVCGKTAYNYARKNNIPIRKKITFEDYECLAAEFFLKKGKVPESVTADDVGRLSRGSFPKDQRPSNKSINHILKKIQDNIEGLREKMRKIKEGKI